MANTTLTQTGAQVQADLDKVEGMANIKTVGSGLSLSSAGQLSTSGGSLPTGGTAGQVLTKVDGTDYNTQWADASGGGSVTFGRIYLHYGSAIYGDYENFTLIYADGTSASNWTSSGSGVVYIKTNGPFRLKFSEEIGTISQVVIKYGSSSLGTDYVPFVSTDSVVEHIMQFHSINAIGTYTSASMFTLIGKDLHIYYSDQGRG